MYRLKPDYTFTEVEVENRRASSKYMWMPYETAVAGDARSGSTDYDQDRVPEASGFRGMRSYTLKIFDSDLKDYDDTAGQQMLRVLARQDGFDAYLEKESVYRTFAYEHYTDVEPEDEKIIAGVESLDVQGCRNKSLDYCLYKLRDTFTKEYKYDTETTAAPKGRDALEYFLNDSRTGNCMHFATAAVLFLREAGFPARYAEGYYVSPEQIDVYAELQNVKIPVADSDSHAWAEVYVDGLGWMPVEVTPGFYDMQKRKSDEKEETEKLTSSAQQEYPEELEVDDESDLSPLRQAESLWPYFLAAVILLMALITVIRRVLLKRVKDMPRTFRYMSRVLAVDRINIKDDPYRPADTVSERYDEATSGVMSYRQAMRLIYRERFSDEKLYSYELKKLDEYSRAVARAVYARQPWYKKIWMSWIRALY